MEHLGSQNPTTKRGCINNKTTELNNTQKKKWDRFTRAKREARNTHTEIKKKLNIDDYLLCLQIKKTKEGIMKKKKNRRSLKN